MKRFIAFYTTDLTGKLVGAMGSDGYHPLDGRVGLHTAHSVALEQAERLARVKPWYIGYQVRNGDLRSSRACTNPLPLPGHKDAFNAAMAIGFTEY